MIDLDDTEGPILKFCHFSIYNYPEQLLLLFSLPNILKMFHGPHIP